MMNSRVKNIAVNTLIFGAVIYTVYRISKQNIPSIKEDLKKNYGL